MARKIRVILAAIFWLCLTALFLDFTGTLHAWLGWMAKIQFLPAVLALNVGVVIALVLLTLVFGRVYCSVICPLGVFQDIISWFHGKTAKKKRLRFSYSPAKNWLRYGILALFIVALVAGVGSFVALLAPYSAYGRIVSNLFAPIYQWGNNLLALVDDHFHSYAFYTKDVWIRSLPTFIIAAATFIAVTVLAWKGGRTWCNTICPVGSILGLLSRFSLFGPVIKKDKCVSCGLCSKGCKASCIDIKNHRIDYSRCVDCMDCLGLCHSDAISYSFRYGRKAPATPASPAEGDDRAASPASAKQTEGKETNGRRAFMTGALLAAGSAALKAQEMKVDGGLAAVEDKQIPHRDTKIVPAGSVSIRHLEQHCTGCQLCVSVCPNDVLRPSTSLMSLMQPQMSYERGFCRPECTRCSEVCPAGAILKVSPEEKTAIQIGHAVVDLELCLVNAHQVDCGNCARHCPAGAISMVLQEDGYSRVPAVNTEKCIGCGACEYVCPSRPISAIHVEGHEIHRKI